MRKLEDSAQIHVDGLGLNDRMRIYVDNADENAGGARHCYVVMMDTEDGDYDTEDGDYDWPEELEEAYASEVAYIQYQHGPRAEEGSIWGATDDVILACMIDRYKSFQAGPFKCRENAIVITKLEEALHWMQQRAQTRRRQGVLGKNLVHKS